MTNTIVGFTTDNGTENFTWPDGGQTPFAGGKGTALEGGFRVPMIMRWPGQGARGQGRERHRVRARLVPDFRRRGRQPEHRRGTEEGQAARRPHLQGPSRRLQPDGPDHRQGAVEAPRDSSTSPRARSARCASTTTSTASPISRTAGSAARVKVDWPILVNLRLDPFERTGMLNGKEAGRSATTTGSSTSSGASCSCSRRWQKSPRLRSSSRRCRRARASIWRPSRSRSRRPSRRRPESKACCEGRPGIGGAQVPLDFRFWHYPEAFEGINEFRSLRCCGPVLLMASSSLDDPLRTFCTTDRRFF